MIFDVIFGLIHDFVLYLIESEIAPYVIAIALIIILGLVFADKLILMFSHFF